MKLNKLLRVFTLTLALGSMTALTSSCSKDKTESGGPNETGPVTGIVLDDKDAPLPGVAITVSDVNVTTVTEVLGTAISGADGKYTVADIPVGTHIITFEKKDYQKVSATTTAASFKENKTAVIDAKMAYAAAKISGLVTDAKNNNAPLAGVTVSITETQKVVTGTDGKFLFENLVLEPYTVSFALPNYTTVVRKIATEAFIDGLATLEVAMGGKELLRGMTAIDLQQAEKWHYNEYRGGRNSEQYPHWDWACNYMCTLDFRGAWEEQNEGTTLQIRNNGDEKKNPADMEMFDSFVFGSKLVTEDNKIMTLQIRTHSASDAEPTCFGVQVIDLSAAEPSVVKIGGDKVLNSSDYKDFDFDLSPYIGKEVVIAIGTYRQKTGDYWKQLVLRRIAFADTKVIGWGWLPGTLVSGLENWKMTEGMVRSTMPQTKFSFTGISPISGNKDKYVDAYRAWRDVAHIGAEWSFMPVRKDPEVFPSEGYLIKTRGNDAAVNTIDPESYFYTKFSIKEGHNKLTLKTRTFGSTYTFFKLTAITEDCVVTHIAPVSNTAQSASAANDGCWKFNHDKGGANSPKDYASFVYDLSQFNGKNVLLVFGVFKGEANGDENKLLFYNIDLN